MQEPLAQSLAPPSPFAQRRAVALHVLEALAIGACGGFTFAKLGLPAGFLSGSMLLVAIASLSGRPLTMPPSLMHVMTATLGMTLGSVASPEMMHGFAAYPVSISLLGFGTVAVVVGSAAYLRYVHQWDWLSATLAATPGASAQMVAMAIETKSDQVGIAIAQLLRVVLLAAFVPIGLAVAGYSLAARGGPAQVAADWPSLALLVGVSALSGFAFQRSRFPGGWLFGSMFGSGLLHGFGVVHGGLPLWIVSLAMIGIGTTVGTRFAGIGIRTFLRYVAAGFGSLVVSLAIVSVFVALTIWLAHVSPQDAVIAFAPGAIDVMMAVALTLHIDPIFVGAHHLFRFIGVSLVMPLIVRAVTPRATELPDSEI